MPMESSAFIGVWRIVSTTRKKCRALPCLAAKLNRILTLDRPMPAYSSTPLAQKLGIKDVTRYLFVNAPAGFEKELPTIPGTAVRVTRAAQEADLIVLFANDAKALTTGLPALIKKVPAAGGLWIAWPKMASGVP